MRNALLLYFIVLLSIATKAQTYYPFPSSIGGWGTEDLDDFYQPTHTFTAYKLEGDTLIDTLVYKKFSTQCISAWSPICGYTGAIREENKIIYFLPKDSTHEFVLYNFNLQLGDTVFYPYSWWNPDSANDTFVVSTIDSVFCADGNYHKQYRIGNATIIEGVGSICGPLFIQYQGSVSGGPRLNCSVNDSIFMFQNPFTTCITSVEEKITPEFEVSVFPNPTNNFINISAPNKISSVQIINSVGQICYSATLNSYTASVDASVLDTGLYFVRAIIKGQYYTQKLIITE